MQLLKDLLIESLSFFNDGQLFNSEGLAQLRFKIIRPRSFMRKT